MTVGIVVVSHSRALAEAAVALAGEMLHGDAARIEVAAGLDDGGFGTDAVAIADALGRADGADGVVVLMDLGSAVLSAETALDLMEDDARDRVVLCPAPLVEGLVVAAVTADGGATAAEVAAEASAALAAKQSHLGNEQAEDAGSGVGPTEAGESAEPSEPSEPCEPSEPSEARGTFIVSLPHGLHARPAAVLVRAVRGLDADVRVRNTTLDGPAVLAGSLSRVATLGALRGHEVEVTARGRQAEDAVRSVLDLARDSFGEEAGGDGSAPPGPTAPPRGLADRGPQPVSPGIGIGPARWLRAAAPEVPDEEPGDADDRRRRLDDALDAVRDDLRRRHDGTARDLGAAEAAIFDAHLLLLDDPDLLGDARDRIADGQGPARAWADAAHAVATAFAGMADEYQRGRAADVRDVRDQVLRRLLGSAEEGGKDDGGHGDVLVATDLTPAQAAALDPAGIAAVVLAGGSPTAHSAILLRSAGIPAVVGAAAAVTHVVAGTTIAVDGASGEVVVDPDAASLAAFRDRAGALARRRDAALVRAREPAATTDGTTILVGANVGSAADATAAVGADLAGLVRTEFCFLDRLEAPTVAEQEAAYRAVAEAMGGRRITLRTLDVGGDKPLVYLPLPREANPFLGVRGIRLAVTRPDLLADQLLAVVRVAHDHPVDVMVPMVSTVDELLDVRERLNEAVRVDGRDRPAGMRVGIMVEVPATALKAAAFAPHVDFLSIGTNDLTQYALAAERGNEALAGLADPLDPGVLALIAAAARVGTDDLLVAVCGEMAGDVQAVALLIGLGVRELSVAPGLVPSVKEAVRAVDLTVARELAARALEAADVAAVRSLLASVGR